MKFIFLSAVFIFITGDGRAQGPPIHTDTPIMLGLQGRGIRMFFKLVRKQSLLSDGEETENPSNKKATALIGSVAIPFNLFNSKFQMGAILPFKAMRVSDTDGSTTNSGVGDMSVFAKYLLFQHDEKNKTIRVASKLTAILPTGDENGRPPLGMGAGAYAVATVAGWVQKRFGIYMEGIYRFNSSEGTADFGDSFSYNLALGHRLSPKIYRVYPSPQLNGFLELNGSDTRPDDVNGAQNHDSGGRVLFLSPGIQVVGGRRWLVEASLQYPIVNDPNGTQLATDWTLSLGTRILLF